MPKIGQVGMSVVYIKALFVNGMGSDAGSRLEMVILGISVYKIEADSDIQLCKRSITRKNIFEAVTR